MNFDPNNLERSGEDAQLANLRKRLTGLQPDRAMLHRFLAWAKGQPLIAAALIFSVASAFYWLFIASDRYQSEARVIVQQTDSGVASTPDLAAILAGNHSVNRADQLITRDYLLSRDVVAKLDKELDLTGHYGGWSIDPFSHLAFANSREDLFRYYQTRVSVDYDEYVGVLVVRAQAFDPVTAQKITAALIAEGERFMNAKEHSLAAEQVAFLEQQVEQLNERAITARQAVIAFQNRERLASPEAQAESIGQVIGQLEAKRAELEVQLASQRSFLVDNHPVIVELQRQIAAIDRQIAEQNARLASPRGGKLNSKVEQLERLQAQAKFAEDLYRAAIVGLEKGQVESTRNIKKLSIIQQPNLPQEAELPDRLRKTLVFALLAFLLAGVLQLLVMIVRDHRD